VKHNLEDLQITEGDAEDRDEWRRTRVAEPAPAGGIHSKRESMCQI